MKSNTEPISILSGHCLSPDENAILALLVYAVDPKIGGVLLVGHEDTANKAAVKCLAALLSPLIEKRCCRPGRDGFPGGVGHRAGGRHFLIKPRPLVTIPADCRAENLSGDHEESDHVRVCSDFCPNLLAAVDQGVLYVPQINRLGADLREKIFAAFRERLVHVEGDEWPSSFLLVASVDSEAHGLTRQELDCFGLYANRAESPSEDSWCRNRKDLSAPMSWLGENPYGLLPAANKLLPAVQVPGHIQERLAAFPGSNEDDPQKLRSKLQTAARALAALCGRKMVSGKDLDRTATMVLPTTVL
jgi:magnesium chelatase subunit D